MLTSLRTSGGRTSGGRARVVDARAVDARIGPSFLMADHKSKAVAWMLFSTLSFAVMAAAVRLSGELPLFQKVLVRNLVSLLVAAWVARKAGRQGLLGKPQHRKHLLSRALLGLLGVATYFVAIGGLYLADATMLNKLSPFFVTLFAASFLGERLGRARMIALAAAFASGMLIVKPRFDLSILPAVAGLISAIASGGAYTLLRYLREREEPATIIFQFSLLSVLATLPLLTLGVRMPTTEQAFYLLLIGLAASAGQFGLTLAYRHAPAGEVSIYNYTGILFAAGLGWLLWGEVPDLLSVLGGLGIVATAAVMFSWESERATRWRWRAGASSPGEPSTGSSSPGAPSKGASPEKVD